MALLSAHTLSLIFGIFGNVVSFFVFLSPMRTFYKIYKRKSSQGYQSIPYVTGLFSASLLLYYGVLKTHAHLIISINGAGCMIEIIYLIVYVVYATTNDKKVLQEHVEADIDDFVELKMAMALQKFTLGLIALCNVGCFGLIVAFSLRLAKGSMRVSVVGWACAAVSVAVFAAPLSIMRQVIRTKSVEFMPIGLSICLTLNATAWFFYGFFIKDYYIASPNILGFVFGIVQIMLYLIYKNGKKDEANRGAERNAQGAEDLMTSSKELELGDARAY